MDDTVYPWGRGTVKVAYDATPNQSDRTVYTVPEGKIAVPISLEAQLTASGTVGNRSLACVITDGTNLIFASVVTGNLPANQIGRLQLMSGVTNNCTVLLHMTTFTTNVNTSMTTGWSRNLVLPAGSTVRVLDRSAIDVAADDLVTSFTYMEYDA